MLYSPADLSEGDSQVLWEDDERAFCRGWRVHDNGGRSAALFVVSVAEHPPPSSLDRLRHEYELRDTLDQAWAARPLELVTEAGRTMLVLEDPGGELLYRRLGSPMEMGDFLRLAIGVTVALGKLHHCGLVHRDIKPAHILISGVTSAVRLTGFGIASRVARERQFPRQPETLAGTLAYMAPEQTGRMNRSVDSRSDLYALGVTFYQMLTGALPFTAAAPMEWVHCHLARRPVPPAERLKEIPGAVSAVVMKLLSKWAEDRYQSAAGLEHDLRRCLSQWEAQRRIDEFPLGKRDIPDRLLIPEKIYGREGEVEALLSGIDRVVEGSGPELLLVSGYSGIGKSSVINELHPALVPAHGLFASGKFDQYRRDIPYATLAQAFQRLIRQLLTKNDSELGRWRRDLLDALDQNGQLIIDLVPELQLIIGEQSPVPDVPARDAQRRFQMVFRRFIAAFARQEHPLALFLDDLQWLDAATLDLLEDLLTRSELQHLLLIGAYRENEVDAVHPLTRKLEAIKSLGGKITQITLGPLARQHLEQLLVDALRCEPERCAPLAQLVLEKTGGNPFFAIQFITSLAAEELLTLDQGNALWSWDLARIHAKGYTDNVVDLMTAKLNRLPSETQTALQQLAALGSDAELTTLSTVLQASEEQVHAALWEGVRQGLVERLDDSYKFLHDRIRESAYALIPEASRAESHLCIGRLLVARTPPAKREERVFEIVNHLNRGMQLITSRAERENLAELNLNAGRRAKASTAYVSALKYLNAGVTLLGSDGWDRRRDLMFALDLARAECEFLTGEMETADANLTALYSRTVNAVEHAAVACSHMGVCLERFQPDRAVAVGLDYLRKVGIEWSPHPTEDAVRYEYTQIGTHLGGRPIESIAELPLMSNSESLATAEVLANLGFAAAINNDETLNCLAICKLVNICLQRGNCDASCYSYVVLSRIAVGKLRDYRTAFRFGQVGVELMERQGFTRFQARTYVFFADLIVPWVKHVRIAADLLRRALDAANRFGDMTFENYANFRLSLHRFTAGDPLSEVQREAELGPPSSREKRFTGDIVLAPMLALVRTLRGLTPNFGSFDCEQIEEVSFERLLASNPYLEGQECWYWLRKTVARYFAGDYVAALEASSKAQSGLHYSTAMIEEVDYHFYSALSHAALCDSAMPDERGHHLDAMSRHHRELAIWAQTCPENFDNRVALIGAEIARLQSRDLEAMRLYERAIHSARTNGFVNNEALAYERAAGFYAVRGFQEFANAYLRSARACYSAWGADGKVRQLDRENPGLKGAQQPPDPTSTISSSIEGLDLTTVIDVSQAVSGEIVLEKALEIVMRKAMEHAGAERGLLIVPRGDELRIEAESKTDGNNIVISLDDRPAGASATPESILRYVVRTHEGVILDDASSSNQFTDDPYVIQYRARSILCLPLLNQAKLTGILYLENNLVPRAFTPERITVLRVLASQAAISLENTRLYDDLEDREAKIRRLVDANILGIFIWNLAGEIIDANEAFLRMLQYSREHLASMRWRDLTPVEWRERDERAMLELQSTGTVQPYEKEFIRADGIRVPVLLGAAAFDEQGDRGVAFVLDLTARKHAENALQLANAQLAQATRIMTLNALTASIAHEVNQPLAGIITNASTCLRMLDANPPNVEGARETARRTLRDGNRASDVIQRVRTLFSKKEVTLELLDLNEATRDVIAMLLSDLKINHVVVRTEFAGDLPRVTGDRVQLQQVILNMVRNGSEAMRDVHSRPRELVIKTERDAGDQVRLSVTDVGGGFAPATAAKLFEPFYTTKSDGMGIGLSISRSIIEAHHGRLWATANEGPGATFCFSIPCDPDRAHEMGVRKRE